MSGEILRDGDRILIVGVDWMGDVLLSTALARAIRSALPHSYVAYSTPPRCARLLSSNPNIDEIIPYQERVFFEELPVKLEFVRRLRTSRFTAAVFLHRSASRAFFVRLAGVPLRAGYARAKNRRWLTHTVAAPAPHAHRSDVYLDVLRSLGVPDAGREPDFFVIPEDERGAVAVLFAAGLGKAEPFVLMHVGGNWDLKRWPVKYFAEVAAHLSRKGIRTVVCGAGEESALASELCGAAPAGAVLSICGKTSIGELAAVMKLSSAVVSNDSGPLHLAAAVGARLVGIFGPTSAAETGPIAKARTELVENRVGCEVPCYFGSCHHRVCMDGLSSARVIAAVDRVLGGS